MNNHPKDYYQDPPVEEDPFDKLLQTTISVKDSEGNQKLVEPESEPESSDSDYENHNPSFLQIPDEDEEEDNSEPAEISQPEQVEESQEVKITPESQEEIPEEKLPVEEPGEKYFPPESNYLEELHQNLLEQEQKEAEEKRHKEEEKKVINLGPEPVVAVPVQDMNQKESDWSEFEAVQIASDQNVICVNNQEYKDNEINQVEQSIDRISSLVLEEPKEEEKGPKMPRYRNKSYDVHGEVFARKINLLAGNQLPKVSLFASFASSLKSSIVGMSEQEADTLCRIDEGCPELSNQDVILAKPGCVIRKCWRLKNLGTRQWPKDTRLVSVTDGLFFVGPRITEFLKPGEMMDLGINIYITPQENGENNIKEFILRLY